MEVGSTQTTAVVVALALLTICCAAWGQGAPEGTGNSRNSAPGQPAVVLPNDPSFPGGRTGDGSGSSCTARSSCSGPHAAAPRDHNFYFRNCFCDDACSLYDDCCDDHIRPARSGRVKLAKSTVVCERFEQIDIDKELYVVTSCPGDSPDDYVREHCEDPPSDDVFYTLPVSGATTGILYRNYYCALCAGEEDTTFWQPTIECNDNHSNNSASFLDDALGLRIRGCWLKYTHPTMVATKCKWNVGRCPKDWTNKKVRKGCKKETSYVYVDELTSKWVFKNKHCAECNMVNDTYLTCEDPRAPPGETGPGTNGALGPPFAIYLDLDTGRGSQFENIVGSDGAVYRTESAVSIQQCAHNEVYDPFDKICRTLFCEANFEFQEGQCVRKTGPAVPDVTSTTLSTDVITQRTTVSPPSSTKPEEEEEEEEEDADMVSVISVPQTTKAPISKEMTTKGSSDDPGSPAAGCQRIRRQQTEYSKLDNGSIYLPEVKQVYEPGDYVMDGSDVLVCAPFHVHEPSLAENVTYSVHMFQFSRIQSLASFVGSLISLMAMFIHFVVYVMLPPLRNIAGRCVISLVLALFMATILFIGGVPRTEHEIVCVTLAALMHYCFLAVFFWMNVIAFDIWHTFCVKPVPQQNSTPDNGGSCRFVLYSVYAWLVPALVVGGSLALDFLDVHELYRPHYGEGLCWITSRYGLLFLFAMPLALLLFVNIFLYLATVRQICLITKGSQNPSQDKERNRFLLHVQLAVIMGLTWVFGFLAALTQWHVLWYVFIALLSLQGVFICFAYICTRKVFRLLRDRGRVHRTTTNGRYPNSGSRGLAYTQRAYMLDGEAKVISQETSI